MWGCLSGLFGLDSVRRKFGQLPPPEWDLALAMLSDEQLQYGLTALMKSGKGHCPSLPEFVALSHSAREFYTPPSQAARIEDNRFDKWDIAANQHFLAEVLRRLNLCRPFTQVETPVYVRWKNAWARDCRDDDTQGEGVPIESQRLWWADVMAKAQAECERKEAA